MTELTSSPFRDRLYSGGGKWNNGLLQVVHRSDGSKRKCWSNALGCQVERRRMRGDKAGRALDTAVLLYETEKGRREKKSGERVEREEMA